MLVLVLLLLVACLLLPCCFAFVASAARRAVLKYPAPQRPQRPQRVHDDAQSLKLAAIAPFRAVARYWSARPHLPDSCAIAIGAPSVLLCEVTRRNLDENASHDARCHSSFLLRCVRLPQAGPRRDRVLAGSRWQGVCGRTGDGQAEEMEESREIRTREPRSLKGRWWRSWGLASWNPRTTGSRACEEDNAKGSWTPKRQDSASRMVWHRGRPDTKPTEQHTRGPSPTSIRVFEKRLPSSLVNLIS